MKILFFDANRLTLGQHADVLYAKLSGLGSSASAIKKSFLKMDTQMKSKILYKIVLVFNYQRGCVIFIMIITVLKRNSFGLIMGP